MNTTREQVESAAKSMALLFVDEFGTPIDPSHTDWDVNAWDVDCKRLGLLPHQRDRYWPVYQSALVAESKRLTAQTSG